MGFRPRPILITQRDKQRFFKNVSIGSPCLLWTAQENPTGYGYFWLPQLNSYVLAHRFAYTLFNGVDPGKLLVCHSCDVPRCVSAEHLFLGTYKDNIQDAVRKGR